MRSEYRPESPWKALLSVQALMALGAMAAFYFSIATPDKALLNADAPEKALLNADAPEKAGQNSVEVLKEARKSKAYVLMEGGHLAQALVMANQNLDSHPGDVSCQYTLALILHRSKRDDDALMLLKRALAQVPRNKELRMEYARMLAEAGKIDDAVSQYHLLMTQAPNMTAPRVDLAQLYLNLDRPAEAAKELEELLKITPNNVSAHKVRGIALARAGRAQEGMDEYLSGMVTEHGAGQPEAVKFIMGSFGDIDRAKFELEQQSNNNPDDPMPKLRLAEIYLYADQPESAKQYLLDARKLAPANPEIHRSLCVAYKRLGDNRQALTSFMQSVALEQEQNSKLRQKIQIR
ncbi:MAG: tetratricopeptide repeat protein [Candidatus Obscuribacterales bacterium]|nr:tetratricopeptide repeat protein [Candidatus Obscuribacterales bacterium]